MDEMKKVESFNCGEKCFSCGAKNEKEILRVCEVCDNFVCEKCFIWQDIEDEEIIACLECWEKFQKK